VIGLAASSGLVCYQDFLIADIATLVCEDRMSSVIDDYLVDPEVSLLDKTRMQAQVLVPVLRALRAELGKDKADAIVKQALRDWSKQLFAAIGDGIAGSPRRKWTTIQTVFGEVSGKEVETRILRHDKEGLDIDVTRCSFAEFFRALGEPELGALLICEADFDIVSVGEGEVSLERAQTIMQGAPSCTFRYKFAPR
jgi:predicted ArsR family transcriptional regulator